MPSGSLDRRMSPRASLSASRSHGTSLLRERARTPRAVASRAARWLALSATSVIVLAISPPAAGSPAAITQARGAFPGGPHFVLSCGFSHRNNDDPIVFPGEPGRSHNHTFIGNRSVDAASTPASLQEGASTCEESDSSTYWVPTLYEGIEPITPLAAIVYYTRHTSGSVVPLPPGLKIVAGNASATRPQAKDTVSWSCGGAAGKRFTTVPVCSETSALVFNVRFPNCWNGKATDSANHKSHMAYSAAGICPTSHPVRLPTISLVLIYSSTSRHARPSSGKFAAHADFMNGWDQKLLARLVSGLNY